jgi:hypothetical protein
MNLRNLTTNGNGTLRVKHSQDSRRKTMKKTALVLFLPLLIFGGYGCHSQSAEKTQAPAAQTGT